MMNTPQIWRLKGQRLRLEGSVCPVCGHKSFPPRQRCPHCIASRKTNLMLNSYEVNLVLETARERLAVGPA
jgi:uncharacterized OB-fold protein